MPCSLARTRSGMLWAPGVPVSDPILLARKSGNMSGGASLGRPSEDPGVAESLRAVGESLRRAAPT